MRRGFVSFPRAYTSSEHDWLLVHPSRTNPITWLDWALYSPPRPADVFAEVVGISSRGWVSNSDLSDSGLVSAYLLEQDRMSALAKYCLKGNTKAEVVETAVQLISDMSGSRKQAALAKIADLCGRDFPDELALHEFLQTLRREEQPANATDGHPSSTTWPASAPSGRAPLSPPGD
jgi:hypothetical protein